MGMSAIMHGLVTVDVEGIPWISGFVGVDGIRDGLTEGLKRAEEALKLLKLPRFL